MRDYRREMSKSAKAVEVLAEVTALLPRAEERSSQIQMTEAVAEAIYDKSHLVVQAGTGTGKSLAYLIPALVAKKKTVVATATKALQDQLANKELPTLNEAMSRDISWTVLKGRSNYLCLQRLDEAQDGADQLGLEGVSDGPDPKLLDELAVWTETTPTGDRADLKVEPTDRLWAAVSVGPRECPGASQCPRGDDCFAEKARQSAANADVTIVNTHLYGLHLATNRGVLPHHDVLIVDEAHETEDVISATTGRELSERSFSSAARLIGSLITDEAVIEKLNTAGRNLSDELVEHVGSRLRHGVPQGVAEVLATARQSLMDALGSAKKINATNVDTKTRVARVATNVGALVLDIDAMCAPSSGSVLWVGGTEENPRLEVAPIDVGETLTDLLWDPEATGLDIDFGGLNAPVDDMLDDPVSSGDEDGEPDVPDTVIFTSATIPPNLIDRLAIPSGLVTEIDVGTNFNFEQSAVLYCPAHLPEPRSAKYPEALHKELRELIEAAGGRTLALFTSHRAYNEAADVLADQLDFEVLRQGDLPKPALIEKFASEETSCLFATMGYWAGIDVPGPSLSLVTIDKIPFPRPDEPLLQARREKAAAAGFTTIDLPRAATMLSQGAGRLIRSSEDKGVVAIMDSRLANKKSYRWELIKALPPMKRTKDLSEATAFLKSLELGS